MPPTTPALIAPYFDLLAVRGITGAIRANLLAAGGRPGPLGTVQMPKPAPTQKPAATFEPRKVITPTPTIEPRRVHRPAERVEVPTEPTPVRKPAPEVARVWNELPPVQPAAAMTDTANKVEHVYRPPIAGTGTLIDQFL
ncbi:MAG: hypothetical protein AAF743_15675 [Planctomycetota bacterium]